MLHRADQDVGFWLEMARSAGGPVLELACGAGRLTVPLADAGVDIIGVDVDPAMLAAARRRAGAPEPDARWPVCTAPRTARTRPFLVAADMRRFAFAREFRLIFVGYNSLQLLIGPGDMASCIDCACRHLAPGGVIGVEVTDFQRDGAGRADGDPDDGHDSLVPLADAEGIRLSGSLVHDLARRTSSYRRRFAGDGWTFEDEVKVRSLDRGEIETLFLDVGLVPITWWEERATLRMIAAPRP